MLLNFLRHRGE